MPQLSALRDKIWTAKNVYIIQLYFINITLMYNIRCFEFFISCFLIKLILTNEFPTIPISSILQQQTCLVNQY